MKTPILKNKWTYKVEPTKGYIPSDKTHIGDEPYETGFYVYFKEVEKILKWLDMPFSMVSRNESLNKIKARKKHAHPSPYAPKVKLDRKALLDKKIKKIAKKPTKRRIRSDSDIKKI
jgi:hypothetical protein